MSQSPAITIDQLRNQEISAAELVAAAAPAPETALTAPGAPLSVFGRKLAGHGR